MSAIRSAQVLSPRALLLTVLLGLSACGGNQPGGQGAPPGGLARSEERSAVLTRAQIERINASSMEQLLIGRFTGLRVSRDSTGATVLRIRTDRDPLIVLDGMPGLSLNSLWQLNPNDIEEIRVLRESATAVYGMDGIGGVLVINTRRR